MILASCASGEDTYTPIDPALLPDSEPAISSVPFEDTTLDADIDAETDPSHDASTPSDVSPNELPIDSIIDSEPESLPDGITLYDLSNEKHLVTDSNLPASPTMVEDTKAKLHEAPVSADPANFDDLTIQFAWMESISQEMSENSASTPIIIYSSSGYKDDNPKAETIWSYWVKTDPQTSLTSPPYSSQEEATASAQEWADSQPEKDSFVIISR
jgi:hypothetical protein